MENFNITIPVVTYKKREYYIAYSPALKTFGYSKESEQGALEDFDKAVSIFLQVQKKFNTLNEALLNLGWVRKEQEIEQPKYFNNDYNTVGTKTSRQIPVFA
jgi:hypothetical protein